MELFLHVVPWSDTLLLHKKNPHYYTCMHTKTQQHPLGFHSKLIELQCIWGWVGYSVYICTYMYLYMLTNGTGHYDSSRKTKKQKQTQSAVILAQLHLIWIRGNTFKTFAGHYILINAVPMIAQFEIINRQLAISPLPPIVKQWCLKKLFVLPLCHPFCEILNPALHSAYMNILFSPRKLLT